MLERPDVDFIDGLSPVIAIEQKTVSQNPRSTVGTVTEVYDFLRLLYARVATAYSHISGKPMRRQTDDEIINHILSFPEGTRLLILAPVVRGRKGHYRELFEQIARQGFERVRVDGELREITPGMKLDRYKTHDIEVVVDRIVVRPDIRPRVHDSVQIALGMGGGVLIAHVLNPDGTGTDHVFSRHLYCPEDGVSYDDPSPNTFSFNSPYGAVRPATAWAPGWKSTRIWSSPTRRSRSTKEDWRRWAGRATSGSSASSAPWPRLTGSTSTRRWARSPRSSGACCWKRRRPGVRDRIPLQGSHTALPPPLRRHLRIPAPPARACRVGLPAALGRIVHARDDLPGLRRRPPEA